MLARKFLLSLFSILVVHLSSFCQPFYFRHYEVESGLSNNAVICSVQDKLGFMWFGTRDGLNRFDGYRFKVYRFGNNNSKSSGNNYIRDLILDKAGALLIATEKEIYRYDAESDSFNFLIAPDNYAIDKLVSDNNGNIWFISGGILYKYSEDLKKLKIYESKTMFWVTGISIDQYNVLWVSTGNGTLKKYNTERDDFTSYNLFNTSVKSQKPNINIIQCASNQRILVGTNKAGFKIFDTRTNTYTNITLCCEKLDNLFIRSFCQISAEEFCIGTETGIFIYNAQTGVSRKIQKNSSDHYSISDNVIYTIYRDNEGGIWVGTYFGGINYYPRQFTPFQKFYYKPFVNSLSGNIVREITDDKFGNLWIATEDGGLNKFDAKTEKFKYYKPGSTSHSISYIGVHDLLSVEDELWVGTFEHGLDIMNIKSGSVIRHYDASSNKGLNSNFPFCLSKTSDGEIIVGTTNGIYTYKRDKDFFEPIKGLPLTGWYTCVLKDVNGTIWAGMPGKGIYYVNTNTGASGSFKFTANDKSSIASDKINSIFEDSRKNLWFATENGLCKWNSFSRNFRRYGVREGFPSDFMLAMCEDEKGQLWISTTKGLACFNPENGKINVFTTANGLLSDQFNFSSAFKNKEGEMYFGSAKGLISFHPSEFSRDNYVPPVYITGLQINHQEIGIDSDESPLKKSLVYTEKIVLNHNQSTISLDFAALGYTAPQNLEYAYQLEGLANGWTNVKRSRKVSFTKLAPGTYVFRVKASSSSGIWSNKETKLIIEILPPWWASRWGYTIYVLLLVTIIYVLLQAYHQRIEEKNKRKIQMLEIAKEKEMLESKINFFTNVAHEIKTPLTLIKVPLETVIQRTVGTPVVQSCLKIMERNTNRLIELSNQFLDFRQAELKQHSLSLEQINISDFLNDTSINFTTLGEQSNIKTNLTLPPSPIFAYVDVDAFNKIIYNLFSNAIKYADSSVEIILLPCRKDDDYFKILFKNDGHLIPEPLKEKIFEPFYRVKETETKNGTGIGLALARSLTDIHNGKLILESPLDNMNVFSLTLPMRTN